MKPFILEIHKKEKKGITEQHVCGFVRRLTSSSLQPYLPAVPIRDIIQPVNIAYTRTLAEITHSVIPIFDI